jgi:Flp pilus assembly protein TadG
MSLTHPARSEHLSQWTCSTRQSDSRRPSRSRGQSIVELGLALPLLLLLVLGTVDIGRAFFDYIQMRDGAFEGVRYGARIPSDTTGIQTAVTNHGVPSGSTVGVACSGDTTNCSSVTTGESVTIKVTVSKSFTPITTSFLNKYFGIGTFNLNATASAKVLT